MRGFEELIFPCVFTAEKNMFDSLSITGPLKDMEAFNNELKTLMTVDKKLLDFRSIYKINRTVDYKVSLRRTMTIEE